MNSIYCNKKMIFKMIVIILSIFFYTKNYAENLGVIGQVYPIAEKDFLDFIKERIITMQNNGEWKKLQDQFKDNVKKHADRPTPLINITHATETRSWVYDPSITIPYDLTDAEGRIIAKAGTTINPLSIVSMHNAWIFLDGDDEKQVTWVKQINKKLLGKTKLILVNGSVADNEKYFSKAIYFDQEGKLVTKFSIKHVPALVQQDGMTLKISEVAL